MSAGPWQCRAPAVLVDAGLGATWHCLVKPGLHTLRPSRDTPECALWKAGRPVPFLPPQWDSASTLSPCHSPPRRGRAYPSPSTLARPGGRSEGQDDGRDLRCA